MSKRTYSTGALTRRTMLKRAALPVAGAFALPSLAAAVETSSTPYQRPRLKITDIRTAQVRVHGPQTHVRVYTDQGLFGQGEATDAAVGTDRSEERRVGKECRSRRSPFHLKER